MNKKETKTNNNKQTNNNNNKHELLNDLNEWTNERVSEPVSKRMN